jgi:hypothetical protein
MRIKPISAFVCTASILLSVTVGHSQSAYYQAITNLNPAAYWPLQETIQPPANHVEVNLARSEPRATRFIPASTPFKWFPGPLPAKLLIPPC